MLGDPDADQCQAPQSGFGNPTNSITGNKYEEETDLVLGRLSFTRSYNSMARTNGLLGAKWQSQFDAAIRTQSNMYRSTRADGKVMTFGKSGSTYFSNADIVHKMVSLASGWKIIAPDGTVETYDAAGKLLQTVTLAGYTRNFTYASGVLQQVSDSDGHSISFTYNGNGLMSSATGSDGRSVAFGYGAVPDRLETVTYSTVGSTEPETTFLYHYENIAFPYAITGKTDESGVRFATFAYDESGRVVDTTHANGSGHYVFSYSGWVFNSGGNASGFSTVTNPLGQETKIHFATRDGTRKISKTEGVASTSLSCPARSATTAYTSHGFVASMVNNMGVQTTFTRGDSLRPDLETARTEAVGKPQQRVISTQWHSAFRMPTQIVSPGLTLGFTYDAQGRVLSRSATDTKAGSPHLGRVRTTGYTWTSTGLLASVDGPRTDVSDVTTFTYSNGASGDLIAVTNALGHSVQILQHNAAGQPLLVQDENGVQTTLSYNARGWLVQTSTAMAQGASITAIAYTPEGLVSSVSPPGGPVLTYVYDDANRLTSIQDVDGNKIVYTRNGLDQVIKTEVFGPGPNAVVKRRSQMAVDGLGRLLRSLGAAGETRASFAYDLNDNVTGITAPDASGTLRTHTRGYDALNRLISELDPLGGITGYGYDAQDNLVQMTDPRGLATVYAYDGLGDIVSQTSPDTGVTTFDTDLAGNTISRTDARGVVETRSYDALDRLTLIAYPSAPTENRSFVYDDATPGNFGIGRLASVTDASGTVGYAYNERGQQMSTVRQTGTHVFTTLYGYDGLTGRLASMTYPSGRVVTYSYDAKGQVTSMTGRADVAAPAQTLVTVNEYEPFGPAKQVTYGNGHGYLWTRDLDGRITWHGSYGGMRALGRSHTYAAGTDLISWINDYTPTYLENGYTYDALDRLTSATGVYGTETYTYDAIGNRTGRTLTAGGTTESETLAYDSASNRLQSVTSTNGIRSFSYDASGNMTLDQRGLTAYGYSYNAAGRLAAVTVDGAPSYENVYDYTQQRVEKRDAVGTPTYFVYAPNGRMLAEIDNLGQTVREWVWMNGSLLAQVEGSGATATTYYIHTDHLGTPMAMSSPGQTLAWEGRYTPFGQLVSATGALAQPLRLPGQYNESETGFSQNWNREYDSGLGRYIQSDPIGLQGGINTYTYVNSSPIHLKDPTGLFCQDPDSVVCAQRKKAGPRPIIAPSISLGLGAGAAAIVRGMPDWAKGTKTIEELCGQCNAKDTRLKALGEALEWAGIRDYDSDDDWTPNLPWGKSFKDSSVYADWMSRRVATESFAFIGKDRKEKPRVEDHPFGHPDLGPGRAHACPHFNAQRADGAQMDFPYIPGSNLQKW